MNLLTDKRVSTFSIGKAADNLFSVEFIFLGVIYKCSGFFSLHDAYTWAYGAAVKAEIRRSASD